jgi:hypothetical protein
MTILKTHLKKEWLDDDFVNGSCRLLPPKLRLPKLVQLATPAIQRQWQGDKWNDDYEYTRTNINALSGIRTHSLSVQAIKP